MTDHTPFRRAARAFAAAAVAASLARCASAPAPSAAPAPPARTVAVSFDGLGGVKLNELLAKGAFPPGGFAEFAARGVLAGRAIDVTPSLTPAAHIAAITGAPPAKTGIVANQFREVGMPFGRQTSGFAAPIGAETLWEAARRQGKRVAILCYPGADAVNERRRGDLSLVWPERGAKESAFVAVAADAWTDATGASPRSFSPPREARVTVAGPRGALKLRLTATDTTDDRTANYDLVTIAAEDGTALGSAAVHGWFALAAPRPEGGRYTSWCRLEELDPALARAEIYVGAFYDVPAYPDDFRARLEAAVGGWPGPPDYAFMRPPRKPDWEAHEEQAQRLSEYLTRALVYAIRSERFDLLIGYQPLVDEVAHAFEPGPHGGSADAVLRAYRAADRAVAAMLAALSPRDTLLFFSDHGMVPLERSVNLEKFLEEKGWRVTGPSGTRGPDGAPRVQACATSGIAHVYLDPDLAGAARAEAGAKLVRDLNALGTLGDGVLDEVLPHDALAKVGLDHPRSGDVVVLLRPGSEFWRGGAGLVGPPQHRGGHGYRNTTPELDASFGEIGPGVAPARPAAISLLEVAARAARALGIDPPRDAAPAGR